MDTSVRGMRCWLFLSILRISNTASNQAENCKELMFGGLGTGANRIEIEEDNFINLTVHRLDASRCDINDQNAIQVKIAYQDNNKTMDVCKFDLKTVCEVSDYSISTSNCRCLNNRAVQFLKKASSSDSRYYTWTWRYGGLERQRGIFIDVRKASLSDDTATAATTASVTCVFLGLLIAATVGGVVWLRHKAKTSRGVERNAEEVEERGRHYSCSRSGRAADNEVSNQNFSQADEPSYVDILEPAACRNDDPNVTEHYRVQNDNPNYGEVKEQNTRQLHKPAYVCGREHDDPSYEEVKLEKRPKDCAYSHVKKPKFKI